jgi:hypothetical protein
MGSALCMPSVADMPAEMPAWRMCCMLTPGLNLLKEFLKWFSKSPEIYLSMSKLTLSKLYTFVDHKIKISAVKYQRRVEIYPCQHA